MPVSYTHLDVYKRQDYNALLAGLEKQGLSLPTVDEWAYLCGGGCRTLFPVSYTHLYDFTDELEQCEKPFDAVRPILELIESSPNIDFGGPCLLYTSRCV